MLLLAYPFNLLPGQTVVAYCVCKLPRVVCRLQCQSNCVGNTSLLSFILEFGSILGFFQRNLARPWAEFQFLLMSALSMDGAWNWSPSLVICYEENNLMLGFCMFFSGICILFSQVMQQVPVQRTGGNTVRENLVNPFTEINKNQSTCKSTWVLLAFYCKVKMKPLILTLIWFFFFK